MTIALDDHRGVLPFACSLIALMTAISQPAQAQTWRIDPSIGVEERWTDNVRSTSRDEKADFLTSVTPGILASADGSGLDLALDYRMAYDRYAASDDLDGFRHRGLARVNAEVVEDLFFVDARGAISEQLSNQTAAATADDRSTETNTTRVATYSMSPRLQHAFGPWALAQASYRHDRTMYLSSGSGSSDLADSVGNSGQVLVRSGENFSRLLWSYQFDNVHRKASEDVFFHTANTVNAEYRIVREWGVTVHGGHDYLNGADLDSDKYSGVFYGGGVHWAPTAITDLRVAVGQRFDTTDVLVQGATMLGPRTRLNLSHQLGVGQEAQSILGALDEMRRDEFGRLVDPFTGLTADPGGSPFSRSNAVFKTRATRLATVHTRDRDTFTLASNLITRETTTEMAGDRETTAVGLMLTWSHQLTETVSSEVALSGSKIVDAPTDADRSTRQRVSAGLRYAFNPTLLGRLGYSWVDTQPGEGAGVTENLVSVGLRKTF